MYVSGLFLVCIGLFLDGFNVVAALQTARRGYHISGLVFVPAILYLCGLTLIALSQPENLIVFWLLPIFIVFHCCCSLLSPILFEKWQTGKGRNGDRSR